MEKPAKNSKNKFLKFLPRAASAITFQTPSSPTRNKRSDINANKLKTHIGKGFSGPISIIPAEARRKQPKNSSFRAQEPTSPKVSCMGQIKHKKKMQKEKRVSPPDSSQPVSSPRKAKKKPSMIGNIFSSTKPPGRKSDASADKPTLHDRAASLSQLKRFASGRDSFTNFDWTAQVMPVDSDLGNYYSDDESEGEEREVIIPFSAPIMMDRCGGGGGVAALEPRKEINLWKRRTMAQPRPLQVN